MGNVLEESLHLLRPHLSSALIDADVAPLVWDATVNLVPIPRLHFGFECRLADDLAQVDVQQGINTENKEVQRLSDFVDRAMCGASEEVQPNWSRLRAFCATIQEGASGFSAGIPEIWLEFDLVGEAIASRLPCVFLGLSAALSPTEARYQIVRNSISTLTGQAPSGDLCDSLWRCFESCGADAKVSHLGIMHMRPTQALRLNVMWQTLKPTDEQSRRYLADIAWPGDSDEITSLLGWLSPLVDEIRFCLDIGDQVHPNLGLECFIAPGPDSSYTSSRWSHFLSALLERGLCSQQKHDALLAWPGTITPATAASAWPSQFILESLIDNDGFDFIDRRLNHIKLTYQPNNPVQAKGYLIVEHKSFRL